MLAEEDAFWLDAISEHLKARADAMSGTESIDWDETHGTEG